MQSPVRDGSPLLVLGVRRSTRDYFAELWERRHFAVALATTDLRGRHMNSVLGQVWHLLNPALMITVYYFIFGVVLDARRGVDHYITFLVTGVMSFRLAQSIITDSAGSIPKNLELIRSIQFPRTLIPVSVTLQGLLGFLPGFSLVVVVGLLEGAPFSWRLALAPLLILDITMFSLGAGLIAARLGSSYTDFQQVLPHVFRILFYVSGVLYRSSSAISSETARFVLSLNPFYGLVETMRWSVLGTPVHPAALASFVSCTVVGLVAGLVFFRRAEYRYGA